MELIRGIRGASEEREEPLDSGLNQNPLRDDHAHSNMHMGYFFYKNQLWNYGLFFLHKRRHGCFLPLQLGYL